MKPLEKTEYISNWIKDYVERMPSRAQSLVIGISGGIDSSVSSTLSAMTGIKTITLSMPIKQKSSQHDLSLKHQKWLVKNFNNVETHTIELDELFKKFENTLSNFNSDLGMANSRARLRMSSLYYFAALHRYLVAGTGNKVEDFGVGFYTKYGDGGVDLSPIADLLKTEVFAVAKHLEIIKPIQEAAPTDGLWGDDRTDEDQLGATYPELEWAMGVYEKGAVENDLSQHQKKVLRIYTQLNRQNQHKMNPIPVCKVPKEFL